MNKINKRTLWTFIKGDTIGFIESSYKKGLIIQSDYITFCETFSRTTNNDDKVELNTCYLPIEEKNRIKDIMLKKTPVCINVRSDVFGSPFKAHVLGPKYILDITPLSICNAQSVSPSTIITAPEGGVLNVQRCKPLEEEKK